MEFLIVALSKGASLYRDAIIMLEDPDIQIVQLDRTLILAAR